MTSNLDLRIGNQTAYSAEHVLDPFEFALVNGFRAFEFFPDRGFSGQGGWHENDLDTSTRSYIRQTSKQAEMMLSVHAPLEFNPLHAPYDDRLYSTVDFAVEIGATLINLHLDRSQGIERFTEAVQPALKRTAETGLKLAFENTVHTGPQDFNRFFKNLIDECPEPVHHCGMCFDLGHANLFSGTRNDYLRYVDELTDETRLMHLHLHENYGDRDSHLTLFTGPSSVNPVGLEGLLLRLARRHYAGAAILEQWPNPPDLLSRAGECLYALQKQVLEGGCDQACGA